MFPLGKDKTDYHLLTKDFVSTAIFEGREMLKVDPRGLRLLSAKAMHDIAFMLRPEHNEMVAKILSDPEASVNDRAVALTMLLNAHISSKGVLPFCQDTGTATVVARIFLGIHIKCNCLGVSKIVLSICVIHPV